MKVIKLTNTWQSIISHTVAEETNFSHMSSLCYYVLFIYFLYLFCRK